MQFGRKDLAIDISVPTFDFFCKKLRSEERRMKVDLSDFTVEEAHLSTVKGIVLSGPFAGPFIVDIVRYTGSFRTKYFWNGHLMLRRELYLCGTHISARRFDKIMSALKQGKQVDNSTVPMVTIDLLSGFPNGMSVVDYIVGHCSNWEKPTLNDASHK